MENNDFKIVAGIKNGDKTTFSFLFDLYYNKLCFYATSILHDSDAAEDLVQDLFAEIWVDRKKLDIKSSFSAYLFRSVYNSCLDYLKHLKVKDRHQKDVSFQIPSSFNDSLVHSELLEKMESSIEQLPDQCKKIFKLSRFENLKYREIAEMLQISENTVDTQIRRALSKLKNDLKDYLVTLFFLFLPFF